MSRRLVLVAAATWWVALVGAMTGGAHAQDPAQVATEGFVLTGLVVDGADGLAWLREPTYTENAIIPVRPGDTVGPYRVSRILDDRIELEGPGGTLSVLLSGAGSPAVAEPTPQPSRREPAQQPTRRARTLPAGVTPGPVALPMQAPVIEPSQSAVIPDDEPAPENKPVAKPPQPSSRRGRSRQLTP